MQRRTPWTGGVELPLRQEAVHGDAEVGAISQVQICTTARARAREQQDIVGHHVHPRRNTVHLQCTVLTHVILLFTASSVSARKPLSSNSLILKQVLLCHKY